MANSNKARKAGTENLSGRVGITTKESFWKKKDMATAKCTGLMVAAILVIGTKGYSMVSVGWSLQTNHSNKASSLIMCSNLRSMQVEAKLN